MSKKRLAAIIITCFLSTRTVSKTLTKPVQFGEHYYAATTFCMTWQQAVEFAGEQVFVDSSGRILQGHLVTITTPEEQAFIHQTFVRKKWTHAWLGAYRKSDNGALNENWVWITGEPWEYSNWAPGQPESYLETRASLMNYTNGQWHDYGDYYYECGYRFTIVEFEPAIYASSGFGPPVRDGWVRGAAERTIPLKFDVLDNAGKVLGPGELPAPPVIDIYYRPEGAAPGASGDSLILSGAATFFWNSHWSLELKNGNIFAHEGIYIFKTRSGDPARYSIYPPAVAS